MPKAEVPTTALTAGKPPSCPRRRAPPDSDSTRRWRGGRHRTADPRGMARHFSSERAAEIPVRDRSAGAESSLDARDSACMARCNQRNWANSRGHRRSDAPIARDMLLEFERAPLRRRSSGGRAYARDLSKKARCKTRTQDVPFLNFACARQPFTRCVRIHALYCGRYSSTHVCRGDVVRPRGH